MADPLALAEEHRLAQLRIATAVQAATATAWRAHIDPRAVDASFPAYAAEVSRLVEEGRKASHTAALDYYTRARANAGVSTARPAVELAQMDADALVESLRIRGPIAVKSATGRGVGLGTSMRRAEASTVGVAKRFTLGGGREALGTAARRDAAVKGIARVSDGSPCPFCAMLVGRGPVYKPETGSFKPHDSCGCGSRVVFRSDADGGWSPDAIAARELWNKSGGTFEAFGPAFRAALVDAESPYVKGRAATVARMRAVDDAAPAPVVDVPEDVTPAAPTVTAATAEVVEDVTPAALDMSDLAALDALDDAELEALLESTYAAGDFTAAERIGEMLDTRFYDADGVRIRPDDPFNEETFAWYATAPDDARRRFDDALDGATSSDFYAAQWAHANAGKRVSLMPERKIRAEFADWLEVEWQRAESVTNGYMLTPEARAKGIHPRMLWKVNPATARAWASEELRWYWDDNGRQTLADFRAAYSGEESSAKLLARTWA